MTEKYTPEMVAELVAEARALDAVDMHETRNWAEDAEKLADRMADALAAVSAERDAAIRDLRAGIKQAIRLNDSQSNSADQWEAMNNALNDALNGAALDKEGNDDE